MRSSYDSPKESRRYKANISGYKIENDNELH